MMFKPGDKVLCVAEAPYLYVGNIYTVKLSSGWGIELVSDRDELPNITYNNITFIRYTPLNEVLL